MPTPPPSEIDVTSADTPDAGGNHVIVPDTLPLDTIKAAIVSRANEAADRLDVLRKDRVQLNANVKELRGKLESDIKVAVKELAEAKRIANSLTPRKPRTNKKAAPK